MRDLRSDVFPITRNSDMRHIR